MLAERGFSARELLISATWRLALVWMMVRSSYAIIHFISDLKLKQMRVSAAYPDLIPAVLGLLQNVAASSPLLFFRLRHAVGGDTFNRLPG
jgi:hypothetical protein